MCIYVQIYTHVYVNICIIYLHSRYDNGQRQSESAAFARASQRAQEPHHKQGTAHNAVSVCVCVCVCVCVYHDVCVIPQI